MHERAHGELSAQAQEAVDRHLSAVVDHVSAVLWEYAFAIVRSADGQYRREGETPTGADVVVERLRGEAERIGSELSALRQRSAEPRRAANGRSRRASMRESGVRVLFRRTEEPTEAPPTPDEAGNARLVDLARSVEATAGRGPRFRRVP